MAAEFPPLDTAAHIPQFPEIAFDGIAYIAPSWEDMREVCLELAQQIISSGESFDRIVTLARGGLTWSRTLADAVDIDPISVIRIKSYSGVHTADTPQLIQPLTDNIEGKRILIFDEVVDSGVSAEEAIKHLTEKGAQEIKVATLVTKPHTRVKPDFAGFETDTWVVFPHEWREFIRESLRTWRSNGLSHDEMLERFLAIGLPAKETVFFMDLEGRR